MAGAAVAVAVAGARRLWAVRGQEHAVTIGRPIDELMRGDSLPEPLAVLGDRVEVDLQPAPGDWGTEVRVRAPRRRSAGDLREGLREAKQKLETGEVLRVEDQPTAREELPGRLTAVLHRQMRRGGLG